MLKEIAQENPTPTLTEDFETLCREHALDKLHRSRDLRRILQTHCSGDAQFPRA
jgi:hypothetical protein